MVRAGFFAYKVESSTQNRSTNDLKNAINVLIDDFKEHLGEVNKALNEFSKGNFEYDFDVKNVSGNLGSVVRGTKSIGDNVSEILATIMVSGEKLATNIEVLTSSAISLWPAVLHTLSFVFSDRCFIACFVIFMAVLQFDFSVCDFDDRASTNELGRSTMS